MCRSKNGISALKLPEPQDALHAPSGKVEIQVFAQNPTCLTSHPHQGLGGGGARHV